MTKELPAEVARRAAAAEAKASGLVDRLGDAQERQRQSNDELTKVEAERQRLSIELAELQKERKSATSTSRKTGRDRQYLATTA